jgi:transcription elongation factor
VAGHEFVKKVQMPDQKGYIVGQVDRKVRDKKFAKFAVIKSGEHKGLRAKVLFADDNIVKLELLANDQKVVLPRD